jgi:enamine deaminase RidA (YjgF/YER057c/UK114 family)
VARTWLYAEDLLGTYAELNGVRDRVFTEQGLGRPGSFDDPPASTGIQGFHADGRPCFMEVLAVQTVARGRAFSPIQSKMQCEAWDYGSSFSRGMRIDVAGSGLTTLSGTASIAPSGETAHVGDPEAQIQTTLANLESLLEACGKSSRAPGLWTLYFKNQSTWQAWRVAVQAGRLAPLRGPAVFADVCRDDLLFEAEVTLVT